jgi:hypothetical protein
VHYTRYLEARELVRELAELICGQGSEKVDEADSFHSQLAIDLRR